MSGFPEMHPPKADAAGAPLVMLHGGNVANWMWEPQMAALTDRTVITPDLPGFGERVSEIWPGLDAVADDIVAGVDAHGVQGRFDLVGLSLGALTALRVLARHPGRVRSAFLTGAPLEPAGAGIRLFSRLQLAFGRAAWFWRAQARAFGLPEDSRRRYVEHGRSVRHETTTAMHAEVCAGGVPPSVRDYSGPLLTIAGEKDTAAVRRSLPILAEAVPRAQPRLAPGMHHIWNVEDPELFNGVLRSWLNGIVDPRLAPVNGLPDR